MYTDIQEQSLYLLLWVVTSVKPDLYLDDFPFDGSAIGTSDHNVLVWYETAALSADYTTIISQFYGKISVWVWGL